MTENIPAVERSLPFPWRCMKCTEKEIFPIATDYTISAQHDDDSYEVRIPDLMIPTCRNCGEQLLTSAADDRIVTALRVKAGLLTPQEIHNRRIQLGMSQQQLAVQLGVPGETIERWERAGIIQSRAMDNLLRLYFESKEVRTLLGHRFMPPPVNIVEA
jgi:putative zinc finger/helix-turn-helix YgiT family protein